MIKKTAQLFFLSSLIITLFSEPTKASSLSSTEKKISQQTIQQQEEQLALLEKLVNVNSDTTNINGAVQVGEMLRVQFDQLGFKTHWEESPADMHRAGTLIAEHKGSAGKRILLIGHLDTVFPKESSFQRFERQGNNVQGPGVVDDKGGDVVILYALKALQSAGALDHATITVVLTGDEEDSGKPTSLSRKPLLDVAKRSDIALDFEAAMTSNTATIARRGIEMWMIKAQGNEAHSFNIFQKPAGHGAIFELTRILDTMHNQLATEKYLSFSPGIILGGTTMNYDENKYQGDAFGKSNVIARTAIATGDLRFISLAQKQHAEKQISAIVKQHFPDTTAEIRFQDGIPAMPPTPLNLALLKKYSAVSEDLGYGPVAPLDPGARGAGDISYIATMVSANLAGLGVFGAGAHSSQETLDVKSLTIQTGRAALLIYRLTQL